MSYTLTVPFALPLPRIKHHRAARAQHAAGHPRSRVRESRKPGSVRAQAEWLSCSTANTQTARLGYWKFSSP